MKNTLLLTLASVLAAAGCSSDKVISTWEDDIIVVDGQINDWEDNLNSIEDKNASLGVYNNEENLYICFTTDDNLNIMQIMNMGMTLWLIPGSGDAETRGFKYPLKSEDFDIKQMKEKRLIGYEEDYVNNMLEINEQNQTEVQVVNERDYSLYIYPLDEDSGINIKMGESKGQLVYEFSVSIGSGSKSGFSLPFMPGDNIIVGVETGKYSNPKRGNTEGGRSGDVNKTGVPGVEIYSRPEPVDIKVFVTLAELE